MAAMRGDRDAHLPDAPVPEAASGTGVGTAGAAGAVAPGEGTALSLPPLLILHGDADRVVSVRNAAATAVLWAHASGARPAPSRTLQRGKRYPMRALDFKVRGRVAVAVREIAGLDHAWSGGAPRLPYSDPAGPDASALAWAFVARQWGTSASDGV
jgi:poly(3-hydroxybutyrate) depolymerase